jgi:hypothetical protein
MADRPEVRRLTARSRPAAGELKGMNVSTATAGSSSFFE